MNQIKTRAIIFGSLEPGYIDIHIAYGYGMNDGGVLRKVPREKVPEDCRMPNTYIWVVLERGSIVDLFKMTAAEVIENK